MLPEGVTKLIGKEVSVRTVEVEKGAIKRYADAVDDQNPLYYDEEYAKKSKYGSIIAPPGYIHSHWFVGPITRWEREHEPSAGEAGGFIDALRKAGFTNPGVVDVGHEYDSFNPVRAGDTITLSRKLKNITEREGKTGKMVFWTTETTFTNQNGDVVGIGRWNSMLR